MNSLWLIVIGIVTFIIAYLFYGSWLAKEWGLDNKRQTPAYLFYDGTDYVPTKPPVLLGHHFASIAGASPIVGPIQAAVFGWFPVFLWIVLGSIFIGGVQDFGTVYASIRHGGKSILEVIEVNVGKTGKRLFNLFAWLTLILVISSFIDICAKTFTSVPEAGTCSMLFMVIAVVLGYLIYRRNIPVAIGTIFGIILIFLCLYLGVLFPMSFSNDASINIKIWDIILLAYIAIASVVPVWILLQPRDYLNSYLLCILLVGTILGLLVARPEIKLEAFTGFSAGDSNYLFPMLFVTVACGAISGFHSLVGSGTTSKQIDKESDAKLIGYGAMLIEGLFAIVSLITAVYLTGPKFQEMMKFGGPVLVFSTGSAEFMSKVGVPVNVGKAFISLTVSVFALTSLDTATRIGRYILQEIFEHKIGSLLGNKYVSTSITVVFAGVLTFMGYQKLWPIFGSANQLLAAVALLGIAAFLIKQGRNAKMVLIPAVFMFAVALTALVIVMKVNFAVKDIPLLILALVIFILTMFLIREAWRVLRTSNRRISN